MSDADQLGDTGMVVTVFVSAVAMGTSTGQVLGSALCKRQCRYALHRVYGTKGLDKYIVAITIVSLPHCISYCAVVSSAADFNQNRIICGQVVRCKM